MKDNKNIITQFMKVITIIFIFLSFIFISFQNYLLFHCGIELFSIIIAFNIFIIAINTYYISNNSYFMFLGIAYTFVGGFDLIHTLAYKGMDIFPVNGGNLSTQLWIAARYMESLSLLIAPVFFYKKIKPYITFYLYSIVSVFLVITIFHWGIFPTCFIEGLGLTLFKKASEYVISGTLLVAFISIIINKEHLHPKVFRFMIISFVTTILAELSFTFYVSVYGLSNMLGHLFKLISFYLIYKALVETSLKESQKLLFYKLEQSKDEIQKTNEQLKQEIFEHKRTEQLLRRVNRALKVLSGSNQALVCATEESDLLNYICWLIVEVGGYRLAWIGFVEQDEEKTVRPVAKMGYGEGYLDTINITWADNKCGSGPTGTAIRTGKPSIARNIGTDPNFAPWRAEATKRGYASSISLPLIIDSRIFGVLNIYAVEPDAFDEEETKLLTELSSNLAYGIGLLRMRTEHKQVKEKYRNLFETMAEGVIYQNDKGEIISANPAAEKILGLTLDQMQGRTSMEPCWKAIHEDGSDFPRENHPQMVALKTGQEVKSVIMGVYNSKEKKYKWVNINAIPQFRAGEDKPYQVYITFDDITERKQHEEKLCQTNCELQAIFQALPDLYFRLDSEGRY